MSATSRIFGLWPEFVAVGLFFGAALWWSSDMKPLAAALLREGRYARLTLVTLMAAVLFGASMFAVAWILMKIGLLNG